MPSWSATPTASAGSKFTITPAGGGLETFNGSISISYAGAAAVVISIPGIGWWRFGWNPIVSFWLAYIVTRPLGASLVDGFSKPYASGLGVGDPLVSLVAFVAFIAGVAYAVVTLCDVQTRPEAHVGGHLDPRPQPADAAVG